MKKRKNRSRRPLFYSTFIDNVPQNSARSLDYDPPVLNSGHLVLSGFVRCARHVVTSYLVCVVVYLLLLFSRRHPVLVSGSFLVT